MKYDYFILQNLYSTQECEELKSRIEQCINPDIADSPAENVKKSAEVHCVLYENVSDLLRKFRHRLLDINKNCFGLELFETSDYEILHYNKYSSEHLSEYDWHKDACKNECYDIKLTALLNLSTEYQGGEFELFLNGPTEIVEYKSPGSMLIFPSWIPHRVKPVTAGQRLSLSQFYSGPNLK
jgi:PKHD-type hydroxylase